jgi:hypothetical protein
MPPFTHNPQKNIRTLELDEINRISQQNYFFGTTQEVKTGTASYMSFIDKYKAKGNDLVAQYRSLPKTATDMQGKFLDSSEHGPMAQFMEIVLLLANKEGRLGPHIQARVTKTAKPDDEGNSFVDVVVELKNTYIEELAKTDKKYKDIRPSTVLLVDVTTNPHAADGKEKMLEKFCLKPAKKANVLCYENKFGVLGINAPKTVVYKSEEYLSQVAKKFRSNFSQLPGGGISLDNEKDFSKEYQSFFLSFLESVSDSSVKSKQFIERNKEERALTKDEISLIESYKAIIDFIDAYKKTPVS